MRFDDELCVGDFPETAKYLRRHEYFEANNTIVACIHCRFYQPGYNVLRTLESLLMTACKKEDYVENDLNNFCFQLQLQNLDVMTVDGVLLSDTQGKRLLMSQVVALPKIILDIPVHRRDLSVRWDVSSDDVGPRSHK